VRRVWRRRDVVGMVIRRKPSAQRNGAKIKSLKMPKPSQGTYRHHCHYCHHCHHGHHCRHSPVTTTCHLSPHHVTTGTCHHPLSPLSPVPLQPPLHHCHHLSSLPLRHHRRKKNSWNCDKILAKIPGKSLWEKLWSRCTDRSWEKPLDVGRATKINLVWKCQGALIN
jgi:hypothetical protein